MKKQTLRAWLYLLPAILFLGFFLVYPLIDVFVYSMEEGYNFASQTYFGTGFYNYSYVLHDPVFFTGGQKYIPSGCHHRAPIYRLCTADFPGTQLD